MFLCFGAGNLIFLTELISVHVSKILPVHVISITTTTTTTIIIMIMLKQNAVQVIPIVISFTGVILKSLSQSLKRLNLHSNTYIQMQKSVILGTCSIVRKFLNYK